MGESLEDSGKNLRSIHIIVVWENMSLSVSEQSSTELSSDEQVWKYFFLHAHLFSCGRKVAMFLAQASEQVASKRMARHNETAESSVAIYGQKLQLDAIWQL